MKKMRAAILDSVQHISIEQRDIPAIGPRDALVEVNYVGVCGSDMALFDQGFIGDSYVEFPMVLGHEAAGTVVSVGSEVTTLSPGDRVALEPGIPCGECDLCREGKYNLCQSVFFWASLPVVEGALQEYVRHPADFCFKIPDSMTLAEGAMIEPLSVAYHAVKSSQAGLGDRAVVFGAGSVGLLTLLTLKAAGAHKVAVVDVVENRLQLAENLGALTVNAAAGASKQPGGETVAQRVRELLGGTPEFAFETAGNEITMNQAIRTVRPGGTAVFVGYTKTGRANLNVNLLIDKEITLETVFRYRHTYPGAIEAVASGAIPAGKVITDIYPFDQVERAMKDAINHKDQVTKCVIEVKAEETRD